MTVYINPIYTRLMNGDLPLASFQSTPEQMRKADQVDFSMDTRTWQTTVKKVGLILLKIVLFPWGIYELAKWAMQRIVLTIAYPAQSNLFKKYLMPHLRNESLAAVRANLVRRDLDHIIRHVKLERDGKAISGIIVGRPDTIQNKKWIVHVTGNAACAEAVAGPYASERRYLDLGYNLFAINSPAIGESKGMCTLETMGKNYATAISFVETALQGEKVVLSGYSMGGAIAGLGIEGHGFEKWKERKVDHLIVRQMSFGKLDRVAQSMLTKIIPHWPILGKLAAGLIRWCCQIDGIAGSRKASELGIPEVIIQGEVDEIIPQDRNLSHDLQQERPLLALKEHHLLPNVDHNDANKVVAKTCEVLQAWEMREPAAVAG